MKQVIAARISIAGWIIIIVISLAAGLIVDSITLLLDASQGLVTLIVALFVHFSLKKLENPPDDFYHFGYEKYEPFTIALQGIMIILTCLIGVKFAIQDIIHPEDIARYDIPITAAFLSAFISLSIALYMRHISITTNSSILRISSITWFIDCALSFGILLGFLFGFSLHRMGYTKATPYVDPVMAIILALIFVVTPMKTVKNNILELLDAAPPHHIKRRMKDLIDQHKPKSFIIDRLRMRKAGKKIFMDILFLTRDGHSLEEIRHLISGFEKEICLKFPDCDLVIHHKPLHDK